jgi:hypothetical protein
MPENITVVPYDAEWPELTYGAHSLKFGAGVEQIQYT